MGTGGNGDLARIGNEMRDRSQRGRRWGCPEAMDGASPTDGLRTTFSCVTMDLRSGQNAQGASGLVAVAPREKGTCTVACMQRRRLDGVNQLRSLHRLPRIFQEFIVAFGLQDTAPPAQDGPYLHPGLVLMQRSVALGVEARRKNSIDTFVIGLRCARETYEGRAWSKK